MVAYMTERLAPKPTDRVLEIGTGSGYQAAVLSKLVAEVFTIEIVEPLATRAAADLARLGFKNVHVRAGDGYQGWPEAAPFDSIIVTCAPDHVPEPLVRQLKDGGTMIIPVGKAGEQQLHVLEKHGDKIEQRTVLPVSFVPMTGKADDKMTR
jgi:protein-L-isoaspartate(D-aspartate) O-methyltransferase